MVVAAPRTLADPGALTDPRAARRPGGPRGAAMDAAREAALPVCCLSLRLAAGALVSRLLASLSVCLSGATGGAAAGGAARRLSTTLLG